MTALLVRPPTEARHLTDASAAAMSDLAQVAAEVPDTAEARWVLGCVLARLEQLAGVDLGPTSVDPLVVLQRRLGRVHGILTRRGPVPEAEELLASVARLRRAG